MAKSINPNSITINRSDKINYITLSIFIAFALLGLLIVIFKNDIDTYQQFYLRIFIGLSAAGIAAIIPGFLEINLKWLRNTIRAGGAIAVFVIIYTRNPPEVKTVETMSKLEGTWSYDCYALSSAFPYGSLNFGGTANFQVVENRYGNSLSISGRREWIMKDSVKITPKDVSNWQSVSGAITADDKLVYQYQTIDGSRVRIGFCAYNIIRDLNNNITELNGNFFRVDSPLTNGTVKMIKIKN